MIIKMKKLTALLALLITISLVGCTPTGDVSGETESKTGNNTVNTTYSFKTIEELRSYVPDSENDIISVLGYFKPGDGAGGTFYWDADCEDADNGGTVIKPESAEKGRYIRLCDSNVRNVSWFGALPGDKEVDSLAIKAAINDLKDGGTLIFEPGDYLVSEAIELKESGMRIASKGKVTLTATEKMDAVIVIADVDEIMITDINIVGNGRADNGILIKGNCKNTSMKSVSIAQFAKAGLKLNGNVSGGIYEEVNVASAKPSTVGLSIDGGANDIVFTACTFDMLSAAECTAGEFKFTHDITFQNCTFTSKSYESHGVSFVGKDGYPKAVGFYSCDVLDAVVNEESGSVGKNHFFGFMTHNGQKVPDHESIFGSTDDGLFFGLN